jgi:hypothetical protein
LREPRFRLANIVSLLLRRSGSTQPHSKEIYRQGDEKYDRSKSHNDNQIRTLRIVVEQEDYPRAGDGRDAHEDQCGLF